MADELNNQSPTTTVTENEAPQGNSDQARNPDGSLKDQGSTPPSGDPKMATNSGDSPKPDARSFLNREAKPDAKPEPKAEDKGDPKDNGDKDPKAPQGAPEKYDDFKIPDGYSIDDKTLEAATAVFKDLGLNQEGAQKLVDFYTDKFTAAAEAPYKLWADTQSEWVDQIITDFGEAKANDMRTDINKGIDAAFAPKLARSFREAIDLTGAGSNPAMFEAFHTLFKPFLEGTPVKGGTPTKESQTAPKQDARPSAAEAMYPHLVGNRGE